jgi:aminomethyltransferase
MSDIKKTPLSQIHESLGAKMVEFAGFLMPVSYGSILEEHRAVRERVGIFDVSHMGEFLVTGPRAREFVNEVITNDCSKLAEGALQYSVMCREDGTTVDDLLVFVLGEDRLLMVVNAANIAKDFEHVLTFDRRGVSVENASDAYALLAVQGPMTREVLKACPIFRSVRAQIDEIPYYKGFSFEHGGDEVLVTRTGYTGEIGFEIFLPSKHAPVFWERIVEAGSPHGILPVGLGARDTLRFEASYCLYGHELDDETSPLEAGLGWVVKLNKPSFRGIEALRREKEAGSRRTLVGLELEGRNIARPGYRVVRDGVNVGKVTSGAFSPTLEKSLCMASVAGGAKGEKAGYTVIVREKEVPAGVTPLPFYKSRAK